VIGLALMCEERETVITHLTVAFRIRMLTTVVLFGYSAIQGLYSEACQKIGLAELLGRRDMYR
jgi:hypothetical protein